jgi:hypothetical protein
VGSSAEWVKITMLFPIRDNQGQVFDDELWDWWLDALEELLPDATELGVTELGLTAGTWRGYADNCRWIMAVVPSARLTRIRDFLSEFAKRSRQEAMYLDYHAVEFELVREK